MPSTSIKNKETKIQAGTAQTPVTQRHPHQLSPVLCSHHPCALWVCTRQEWECISSRTQQLPVTHRAAHPISVLGTQNCSQSLSRSFSDQNITKGMIHHPWHSLRELHEVTHTRGAVMANPHFKGTSLEIKPAKALKTKQRPLPCQVL